MDVGALSLLIGESGFAATMQKVAQLDAAAAKVGSKVTDVKVAAPTVAPVQAALTRIQQTASAISGQPVSFKFNLGPVQQATAALGQASAATQQNTQATQQNTAAQGQQAVTQTRVINSIVTQGRAYDAMTPKVRSAANGLAALAFAATSGTPSMQSMALAGGLVATSLLEAFGPASVAAYATGIGALVVLLGTVIGLVRRLNADAKPTQQTLEHIGNIDRVESYNRALKATDDRLQALIPKMTAWERFRSFNPLVNLGLAPTESEKQFNQLLADREALVKRGVELQREQAKAVAAAQREAAVSAANNQLRITESLIDRQESLNQQGYALGIVNLRDYFDTRERIARERSQATIRALEAERKALSIAPVGEKPDEAIQRTTRRDSVSAEIEAERNRQRTASQQFLAEREAAERALAQRLLGFERQRLDAQGRTHEARLAQIQQESAEFERALAIDPTKDAATKAGLVNAFRAALTAQENFNESQRQSQRIFEEIANERDAIQQRVARGQISEIQGEREIAAAERARLPELQRIAASMLAFARELKNPDLIAAAERLTKALSKIGVNPFTAIEKTFLQMLDALENGTTKTSQKIGEALRKAFEAGTLKVTPKVVFEVGAILNAVQQLEQTIGGVAVNVGNAIGSSLAAGFSSAFTKDSGKNFAEAFGNAMLQSIGNILVQLGGSMVTYGLIMAAAAPLLAFTPFANQALSAPVAIGAGTALIALGAGLGAIAANNTGSRTGGGGRANSSSAASSRSIATQQTILDPDRRFREREALAQRTESTQRRALAPASPIVNNFNLFGDPTPQSQRFIAANSRGADGRNIPIVRRRR